MISSQMAAKQFLHAGRPLSPGRFLVLISFSRGWVYPRAAVRVRSIERFEDLLRSRTHDLLTCSIASQPTTLLCAPTHPNTLLFKTICKTWRIWRICIRGYEGFCHLGYNGMQPMESQLTFWKSISRHSAVFKSEWSMKPTWSRL
jgi:hypothetical protein